jgi:hypothetical protein
LVPGTTILTLSLTLFNATGPGSTNQFGAPVKSNISLSGTFAELRPDHFHGGIDIKGVEGTPVYAVEDGYLHKLESKGTGYGKVIFIRHVNGYMSIYGHLSAFNSQFTAFYEAEARKLKKSNLSVYLKKNQIRVKKGTKIGEIGNSGFSFGPHLHFEIWDLSEKKLVNPLFFGTRVKDCSAPKWKNIKIYKPDENRVSVSEKTIQLEDKYYFKVDTVEWFSGKTALAAQVYDVMEGNQNKNGVYQLKMFVNGQLYFHFTANKIPLKGAKYANALIDFKENVKSNDIYYRCFRLPGYVRNSYTYYLDDGYFEIKQNQINIVELEALDYSGNYSRKKIALRGKKKKLPPLPLHHYYVNRTAPFELKTYSFGLGIPEGAIYQNLPLKYSEVNEIRAETFSGTHLIHCESEPLHKDIFISIRSGIIPDGLRQKAFISKCNPKGKYINCGGKWRKNFLEAAVDEFGEYAIMIDTIPPTIEDLSSFSGYGRNRRYKIRFRIRDNIDLPKKKDAPFFKVMLNGSWIRMESDRKTGMVQANLPVDLKRGKHKIKIVSWDQLNNIRQYHKTFVLR